MKEMKLTKQQLQEIVDTYDMYVEGFEYYLNIDTAEVVMLNTSYGDEEDETLSEMIDEGFNEIYFEIPHRESREGYRDMVDFAETVADEKLRDSLLNVLSGDRKIFRRFKDTLSSDGSELERYYKYVEDRNLERVMYWLESIDVKVNIDGDSH